LYVDVQADGMGQEAVDAAEKVAIKIAMAIRPK